MTVSKPSVWIFEFENQPTRVKRASLGIKILSSILLKTNSTQASKSINFIHISSALLVIYPTYSPELAPCEKGLRGRHFEILKMRLQGLIIQLENYQTS